MHGKYRLLETNPEAKVAAKDSRYTQEGSNSEYVRSHQELKDAQIRKPRLHEGLSFREKI